MPRAISNELRLRIIEFLNNNYSDRQISVQVGVSRSAVQRWRRRYELDGNVNDNNADCGPKSSISELMKELICLKSIEDPFKSGAGIMKKLALNLTVQSVNRILRQNGLRTYHAAKSRK